MNGWVSRWDGYLQECTDMCVEGGGVQERMCVYSVVRERGEYIGVRVWRTNVYVNMKRQTGKLKTDGRIEKYMDG
jgi:hypothetical protein